MGTGAAAMGAAGAGAGAEVAGTEVTGGVSAAAGIGFGVGTGTGMTPLVTGDGLAPGLAAPAARGEGLGGGVGVLAAGVFLLSKGEDALGWAWGGRDGCDMSPPMSGIGATGGFVGCCC